MKTEIVLREIYTDDNDQEEQFFQSTFMCALLKVPKDI